VRTLLLVSLAAALGCSSYAGSARDFAPARLRQEPGWIAVRAVPVERQREEEDCGAAALAMLLSYWTGEPPAGIAARLRPAPKGGHTAGHLRDEVRGRGLAAYLIQGTMADLERELRDGRPVLVGLVKPQRKGVLTHYELVVALHVARGLVVTLDPAAGWRENDRDGFAAEWSAAHHLALVVSAMPGRDSTLFRTFGPHGRPAAAALTPTSR
jgi:ABC-type bacteriocin/lantibiotic exporter with double-glycine peptidase domain